LPEEIFTVKTSVKSFFTYFLLMATLIPISLFVSIECKRFLISRLIDCDTDIYSLIWDRPAKAANSAVTTDLGQVSYLFSDKTGTLTCNQMKFKSMTIGELTFGDIRGATQAKFSSEELDQYVTGVKTKSVCRLLVSQNNMTTQTIEDQRSLIFEFMKALCLCHEIVTERMGESIKYQGPSPDEIALVDAAADLGFILQQSSEEHIEVNFIKGTMECDSYNSEEIEQAILTDQDLELEFEHNRKGEHYGPGVHMFNVKRRIQFTSDRKRMSILVKDPTTDNFKLFIKGADSAIEQRLDND
jgi:magnesium-transporting ATPase (P-type)